MTIPYFFFFSEALTFLTKVTGTAATSAALASDNPQFGYQVANLLDFAFSFTLLKDFPGFPFLYHFYDAHMPAFVREGINFAIKFTIIFRIGKGDIITDKPEYAPDDILGKVPPQQVPCKLQFQI